MWSGKVELYHAIISDMRKQRGGLIRQSRHKPNIRLLYSFALKSGLIYYVVFAKLEREMELST